MSTSLCFNDVMFDVVERDGQPWVTSRQLAMALGYKDENSVRKIYERNSDEFSSMMTATVKMTVGLSEVMVRIFSMRGCHLIAMFARTAVAKSFRRWVLDVLDKLAVEAPATQPALPTTTTPSTAADRKPLRTLVSTWSRLCGTHQQDLWPQVRANFQLERIDHLPTEWIPDAIAWVQGKIDALAKLEATPEQKALPEASSSPALIHVERGPNRTKSRTEQTLYKLLLETNNIDTLGPALDDFFERLRKVSGPINLQALDAMRRTDDNLCTDSLIQTMSYHRWYAREKIHDAVNSARDACRSAIVVARLLGV